jgi:hypothetical protein
MQGGLRPLRVGMILAVLIVALPCAYFGAHLYRYYRHGRVSDRMETAITRLALNCPSDLTDDQWAYCILWTWNLHCNYGVVPDYIPTADLERIVEDLEGKIDAGPSLATIDWLWDEYYRWAPSAHNYERYRPTSPANQSQLEAGAHGGNPLSWWRSEYERRVAKR